MRIDLPLCSFKDCRYNFDCNCIDKNRKEKCEFDMYKKAVDEQPKIGGWIPCSERLPEPARRYLATVVWSDGDCIVIKEVHNVLYGIDLRWHTDGIYEFEKPLDCKVTAWKPIPIPYEVKEHGQMD